MGKFRLLMVMVLTSFFAASICVAAETTFKAKLTPKEELKQPKSKASGAAEFKLSKDGKELTYKLHAKNIANANAAHIHLGKKGEDGPPVAGLMATPKKGNFSGVLAEGKLTEAELMGSFKGKKIEELADMMRKGDTYVNVHTEDNPAGEIRGQIK